MSRSRSLRSPELTTLPVARYFAVVGSTLAVLLLIAGWSLPELPDRFPDRPGIIDGATIRIESARKWPEKVVLDTNLSTLLPPSVDVAPARDLVERPPDEMTDRTSINSVANAVVKPGPDARPIVAYHPPVRAKHRRARSVPPTREARARGPNELQRSLEDCCWFESMDRRATSRPTSRNRVARRDLWIGWHFPETD
ncbi:hypothetical protein ABIA95_002668 [Bradyrhizobium sp. LA8.1]